MSVATLRAAQIMRSIPLGGAWKHTSRLMSSSIILQSNTLSRTNPTQRQLQFLPGSDRKTSPIYFQPSRHNSNAQATLAETDAPKAPDFRSLDRIMVMFEERCQRNELVNEKDFVKTFNLFTRVVDEAQHAGRNHAPDMSNISQYSALLLRCCGRPMFETPPKGRELLAGNLWTYIKDRKIPLDISHYNSLIRVMNENTTLYAPNKILEEIAQHDLQPDRITYQRLIHQYCLQGDIAGATKLLETMKDGGFELNESTFSSLIIGYSKQEKPPAISEMFELMRQNNVEPGSKSYAAALSALVERFAKDPEGALAELSKVIELLEKDEVQFSANEYIDLITSLGPLRDSQKVVADFFDRHINSIYGTIGTRYRLLSSLLRVNQKDFASNLFWSQSVHDKAIQAGNVGSYYVRALAKNFNVPVEFSINECLKLEERRWNLKALNMLYFSAAESGNLQLVRAAMKKMVEQEPMKALYTWPLIAQAKTKDEVIKVLKEDLDQNLDTSELLETFSQWVWPKFADDVYKLFELNKELKFDSNLLVASFLNYSVQENKIDEAIKFVTEVPQHLVNEVSEQSQTNEDDIEEFAPSNSQSLRRTTERGTLVANLLNQIADQTKDPELVMKVFNMCQLPGQQVSVRSLSALIRVHLQNDNFKGALAQFLRICKEYRATPSRSELMSHCLVNKDPESLQKIMNAVSEIYGETNSLFDLAVCCLSTNKLKQAQKIFASPGFRVRPIRVYQTCRSLARQDNVTVLENFVNLSRDMYDVNQEYLYQVLIDTYDRTSNAKRALNLWNIMQEEEFQPSRKSLVMIANLLEKNNIKVPFQKPRSNYPDHQLGKTQRERDS